MEHAITRITVTYGDADVEVLTPTRVAVNISDDSSRRSVFIDTISSHPLITACCNISLRITAQPNDLRGLHAVEMHEMTLRLSVHRRVEPITSFLGKHAVRVTLAESVVEFRLKTAAAQEHWLNTLKHHHMEPPTTILGQLKLHRRGLQQ